MLLVKLASLAHMGITLISWLTPRAGIAKFIMLIGSSSAGVSSPAAFVVPNTAPVAFLTVKLFIGVGVAPLMFSKRQPTTL